MFLSYKMTSHFPVVVVAVAVVVVVVVVVVVFVVVVGIFGGDAKMP